MSSRDSREPQSLFPLFEVLATQLESASKMPDLPFLQHLRDATFVELALRQQAALQQKRDVLTEQELYDRLDPVAKGFRRGMDQLRNPDTARFYYSLGRFPEIREAVGDLASAYLIPERFIPPPPRRIISL